jgi:hypothetical protein
MFASSIVLVLVPLKIESRIIDYTSSNWQPGVIHRSSSLHNPIICKRLEHPSHWYTPIISSNLHHIQVCFYFLVVKSVSRFEASLVSVRPHVHESAPR